MKTVSLQLFPSKDFHIGPFVSEWAAGSKENVNVFSAVPDGLSSYWPLGKKNKQQSWEQKESSGYY